MVYLAKWIRLLAAVGLISLLVAAGCGKATPESPVPQPFASPTPLSRAPSNQGNVPSVPGAAVLISVIDAQGQPVEEGKIEVSVEFQGNPQWDFSYDLDLSAVLEGGLLPLHPPSSDAHATVSIQVVTQAGEASDTLVVRGGFWEALVATDLDYVAVHEFDLAKSGTISSAVYTTEPQPYPKTQPAEGPGPGQHPITPTGAPPGVDVVDAEVDDGGTPRDPQEAERYKLQGAIDSMMADRGITNVDVVDIAANVWTSLPTGEGSAPLGPVYLRQDETQYFYCWDATGLIIEQHESPIARGSGPGLWASYPLGGVE